MNTLLNKVNEALAGTQDQRDVLLTIVARALQTGTWEFSEADNGIMCEFARGDDRYELAEQVEEIVESAQRHLGRIA